MSNVKPKQKIIENLEMRAKSLSKNSNQYEEMFEALIDSYKSGKLDGLEKAFSEIDIDVQKEVRE